MVFHCTRYHTEFECESVGELFIIFNVAKHHQEEQLILAKQMEVCNALWSHRTYCDKLTDEEFGGFAKRYMGLLGGYTPDMEIEKLLENFKQWLNRQDPPERSEQQ